MEFRYSSLSLLLVAPFFFSEAFCQAPSSVEAYLIEIQDRHPGNIAIWVDSLIARADDANSSLRDAIGYYKKNIFYRNILLERGQTDEANLTGIVRSYNNASYNLQKLRKYDAAEAYMDTCLAYLNSFKSHYGYYHPSRQGRAYHVQGQIYNETKGLEDAEWCYKQAQKYYNEEPTWDVKRKMVERAKVLNDLSGLYLTWMQAGAAVKLAREAENAYKEAYSVYEKQWNNHPDKRDDIEYDLVYNIVYGMGDVYNNLALAHEMQNSIDRSLHLFGKLKSILGIYSEVFPGDTAFNPGAFDRTKANWESIIDYGTTQIGIGQLPFTISEEALGFADLYNNLSIVYRKKKDFRAAHRHSDRALSISRNLAKAAPDYVAEQASYLHNKGEIFFDERKYETALQYQDSALNALQVGLRGGSSLILNNRYYLEALAGKAAALASLGNREEAISVYANAVDHINVMRRRQQDRKSMIAMSAITRRIFEQAIMVADEAEEAFSYSEMGKAYSMLNAVRHNNTLRNISPELLEREKSLKYQIAQNKQEFLDGGGPAVLHQIDSLEKEWKQVSRQLSENEDYRKLLTTPTILSAEEVSTRLLQDEQYLIEYFVGEQATTIFVLQKGKPLVMKTAHLSRDTIRQLANALYEGIQQGGLEKRSHVDTLAYLKMDLQYQKAARLLYDSLYASLVPSTSPENVLIIPDDALHIVPFEALLTEQPDSTGDYLNYGFVANRHEINYCYSASLLDEMSRNAVFGEKLIAFAPSFHSGGSRFATTRGAKAALAPLQNLRYNEQEVATISGSLKGKCDTVLNANATKASFLAAARQQQYRFAHLSTHSYSSDDNPDESFVAFAQADTTIDERQLLYLRELYTAELPFETIMLNSCATNVGRLYIGEGLMSLARGFVFAGVRNIIATRWAIPDNQATKDIAVNFYRNMQKEHISQPKALYLAQKHVREDPNFAHPCNWAGFLFIGNPHKY